jgi:hypothetical protein
MRSRKCVPGQLLRRAMAASRGCLREGAERGIAYDGVPTGTRLPVSDEASPGDECEEVATYIQTWVVGHSIVY